MIIVSASSTFNLAQKISKKIQKNCIEIKFQKFSNGEISFEPEDVDENHALIFFPKNDNINESIVEFMFMANLCKDCKTVDAFIPYIPYSRQDKSKEFAMILDLLNFLKIRKIITIDIHNAENLNDNIINILPHEIFGINYQDMENLIIIAPDSGAITRASKFADFLKCDMVTIDKKSGAAKNIEKAKGKICLIVDDIIDSGNTIKISENILIKNGAKDILTCISHSDKNDQNLIAYKISEIILTKLCKQYKML